MTSNGLKIDEEEQDYIEDKQILLAMERTRMSNERTFLSWVRTAIACIGGGVAIIRLINFNTETHKFVAQVSGDSLIFIGILFLIFSLINFKQVKHQLPPVKGFKEPTSFFITSAAVMLIILGLALLVII